MSIRRDMVRRPEGGCKAPSIRRQCDLVEVHRSTWYAQSDSNPIRSGDVETMNRIDEIYTEHPEYGSRRIAVMLNRQHGLDVNRKRAQRLMRVMNIAGCMPGPNTSKPAPENKVYPYLLRGVEINRPNQVWSTDITYIRVGRGFAYLTAVIDWYSRYVLSWELSNTLDSSFCVEATRRALQQGTPEIFNTDQGSQYTSRDFQSVFDGTGVAISMDGRGRALDNVFVERLWRSVKYEDIYLRDYRSMPDLYRGLIRYFHHYNHTRPHQSMDYKTPAEIHNSCAVVAPLRPRPSGPPLRGRSPQSDDGIPGKTSLSERAWGAGTNEQQETSELVTP
jgi:putative transposase